MKIIYLFTLFLFLNSCDTKKVKEIKLFSPLHLRVSRFENNVLKFTKLHTEIEKIQFFYMFNSEGCSSCTQSKIVELESFYSNKKRKKVCIITNDGGENILDTAVFQVIYLSKDKFKKAKIWHSDIYAYTVADSFSIVSEIVDANYLEKLKQVRIPK